RDLDSVIEVSFFPALFVELHQRIPIARARGAPEGLGCQRVQDLRRTLAFIRRARWLTNENPAAAWRILSLCGVEWTFDANGSDVREVGETRRGAGLHRVSHEVLVEVQNRRKIRLQESDAEHMLTGFRGQSKAHSGAAQIRPGLPTAHGGN